jgi:hypothetical protein
VDQFWQEKDLVYRHVINSTAGILADQVCQSFLYQNLKAIDAVDYFTTEEQLFRKLPGLRQLLTNPNFTSLAAAHVPETISFKRRLFFVDESVDFFERNDRARYLQTRELTSLTIGAAELHGRPTSTGDLFGNGSD